MPVTLYAELPYCIFHGWPAWVQEDGAGPAATRRLLAASSEDVPELGPLREGPVTQLERSRPRASSRRSPATSSASAWRTQTWPRGRSTRSRWLWPLGGPNTPAALTGTAHGAGLDSGRDVGLSDAFHAPRDDPRMPDFFIVGHAKSGTTALYEMLRRHPEVFMPEYKGGAGKEPWYFSRENPHPQTSGERDISFTGRSAMSEQEYLSLFEGARPGQLRGEASSSYLWSRTAPARIAAARPDARIIAIIREPASFLRSLHLQLLQNRHEAVYDFREAVELDQARRESKHIPSRSYWPSALIYSDRVRYVEQLRRYRELFGPSRCWC